MQNAKNFSSLVQYNGNPMWAPKLCLITKFLKNWFFLGKYAIKSD